MPAYNEEEALVDVIKEWVLAAKNIDGMLLIINDGSKDKTLEVLKDAVNKHDRLIVIDKNNSGHGQSCILGYRWALQEGYKWIFQTDSDGQVESEEFLDAWKRRDQHPFIFGFRPSRGDGLARLVISQILRMVIKVLFGVTVLDSNVPFRLMKSERLALVIDYIPEDMFLANAYLAILLQSLKDKIHWVKISFNLRTGGAPSVSLSRFFQVGLKVSKEFFCLRGQFKSAIKRLV